MLTKVALAVVARLDIHSMMSEQFAESLTLADSHPGPPGHLFFSKANKASSLPAKLGRGTCKIFSQSGISRAIHSAIVSLANAVKPDEF